METVKTACFAIPQVRFEEMESTGLALLEEAGCLVVTGVTDVEERKTLREELAPHMHRAPVNEANEPSSYGGAESFLPGYTRRVSALIKRSETAREWIMHPLMKMVCDPILLPYCDDRYQLHGTAVIEVGPNAHKQVLHRDGDAFQFFPEPRPTLVVSSMWAVTDFTAENGATCVVPGSHRWPSERQATAEEVISAEMPSGSVLIWLGNTLHGGGANISNDWRYGVILAYSVGWLRQEENQSIAVPGDLARKLPKDLLDMIGNTMNGGLGYSEEYMGPIA